MEKMADWLHCNKCFHQPGDGMKFYLSSCGHTYCNGCVQSGTKDKCIMCDNPCTVIQLTAPLQPEVELFFADPEDLINKHHRQLIQVIDFQKNHRKRMTAHIREKLGMQNNMMSQVRKSVSQSQDLEREIRILKEENTYLKKLVSSMGGSYPGRMNPAQRQSMNISSMSTRSSPTSSHNGRTPPAPSMMSSRAPPTPSINNRTQSLSMNSRTSAAMGMSSRTPPAPSMSSRTQPAPSMNSRTPPAPSMNSRTPGGMNNHMAAAQMSMNRKTSPVPSRNTKTPPAMSLDSDLSPSGKRTLSPYNSAKQHGGNLQVMTSNKSPP